LYTIAKQFTFEASHVLSQLPQGHQCSRLHGHSYRVEIILQSPTLDGRGFVLDYGDLSDFRYLISSQLDHRHLNDVLKDIPPTAENIARWLYDQAKKQYPQMIAIRVYETINTWAEYREG